MSLNAGISKKVMIHLPLEVKIIVLIVMNFVIVLLTGVNLVGLQKWSGDEKRKVVLQRILKIYRKYKIDRSNTIQLNLGQHDFDMGMKDAIVQAKKSNQVKLRLCQ